MSQKSSVGIKILEIDHIVIRCKDVERQLKFYVDVLGLEPYRVEEFRAGKVFFPSVRVHDGMIIDLFPRPNEEPVGDGPRNLDHYCLTIAPTDLAKVATPPSRARCHCRRRSKKAIRRPRRWLLDLCQRL